MFLTTPCRIGSLFGALGVLAITGVANAQSTPVPSGTTQYIWLESAEDAAPSPDVTEVDEAMESAVPAPFVEAASTPSTCNCGQQKCCCTKKKQEALNKAVAGSYKGVFYLNDFSYINDPCYCDWWPGDHLKQMKVGNCTTVDIGGQYRMRFQSEEGFRFSLPAGGLGLTGVDDNFLLHRLRMYTDVKMGDHVRFYGEMLHADSQYEELRPRPIEENWWEIQNLFLDVKTGKLTSRVGRQEILLGAQRLVSPLDWANTRRTFDGARMMYKGDQWDVDAFWLRPLVRDVNAVDDPAYNVQWYGIYSSYKGLEKDTLEAYWLGLENNLMDSVAPFNFQTIGGRYLGSARDWLLEFEGGYQFGDNPDSTSHQAGFWTAGIGREFDHCWKPTLWFYYDWASGEGGPQRGNGFHHNFPLAHKYLGFMDLFGRRNIESPNVQLAFSPAKKWKCLIWYYYLFLENGNDTPYNIVMRPFQPGVAPISADLGHEIDFIASYTINARMSLLLGYSHFEPGRYYESPGLAYDGPASFFYTQYQFNF